MSILTQEQLLLNAQAQFDALKERIFEDSQKQIRIDQAERNVFAELLALGLTLLKAFAAGAGLGDEGEQVSRGDRTLQRSDKLHRKLYRSIFGTLSILRWVYARGAKKKIEYAPTDAAVRSAAWRVFVCHGRLAATAVRQGNVRRRSGRAGRNPGFQGKCGDGRGDESADGGTCRVVSHSTASPASSC